MTRSPAVWMLAAIVCACTRSPDSAPDGLASGEASVTEAIERGVDLDLRDRRLGNPYAYIPPQCYVRTRDAAGAVHNTCFTCHRTASAPNFVDDAELQLAYDFADPARTNRWTNVLGDRNVAVVEDEVLAWVRADNYFDERGKIALAATLAEVPPGWDADGDGVWSGYVPDCWFAFDDRGFDRDRNGEPTGWRAYVAPSLPGFWPSDGSAGDTMIRLPAAYREDERGHPDIDVYAINLAIVEALMTRRDAVIPATDEHALGVDLDRDGTLGIANAIGFRWAPLRGENMSWVGRARGLQLAAGLLPAGTEVLHSVRYLDVDPSGRVVMATRMKELRYARKRKWRTYGELEQATAAETKEKHDHPDRLRQVYGDVEHGALNGLGWIYQGFIEDRGGDLRPQTFEETVACVGCHSGVGATSDGIFSLPRKARETIPGEGWHHPSQRSGIAIAEPSCEGTNEYAYWLAQHAATNDGRDDAERALALDAAYREIVRAQSFIAGRDATLAAASTWWDETPVGETTGVDAPARTQCRRP